MSLNQIIQSESLVFSNEVAVVSLTPKQFKVHFQACAYYYPHLSYLKLPHPNCLHVVSLNHPASKLPKHYYLLWHLVLYFYSLEQYTWSSDFSNKTVGNLTARVTSYPFCIPSFIQIFIAYLLHVGHCAKHWGCNGKPNRHCLCLHGAYRLVRDKVKQIITQIIYLHIVLSFWLEQLEDASIIF